VEQVRDEGARLARLKTVEMVPSESGIRGDALKALWHDKPKSCGLQCRVLICQLMHLKACYAFVSGTSVIIRFLRDLALR
jgi:hypothetical protein